MTLYFSASSTANVFSISFIHLAYGDYGQFSTLIWLTHLFAAVGRPSELGVQQETLLRNK